MSSGLSTLDPDHRFFSKEYIPEGEESRHRSLIRRQIKVEDNGGFFDGLKLKRTGSKKKGRALRKNLFGVDHTEEQLAALVA